MRLYNVQCLRFLAAAAVLIGHTQHESAARLSPPWFFWGAGVDVFFIISGLIMYVQSSEAFGRPGAASEFIRHRLQRVVPIYWIFTALMIASTLLLTAHIDHKQTSAPHITASFLFFPWPNEFGKLHPILGVGWTLNYEMLFYAIFGASLLFRRGILVLLSAFAALLVIGAVSPAGAWPLRFWGAPIILEFLFGIGLGAAYLRGMRLSLSAGVALAFAGVAALLVIRYLGFKDETWRFATVGLPALMIAAAFTLTPQPSDKKGWIGWMVLAGDASYALYLSHPFTINVVKLAMQKAGFAQPYLFFGVATAASIAASIVIFLVVEKPIIAFFKARRKAPLLNKSDEVGAMTEIAVASSAPSGSSTP